MQRRVDKVKILARMLALGYGDNMKAVSNAAGLGETALRDMLTKGRPGYDNPTPRKLQAIGEVLSLSISEMLLEPSFAPRIAVIGTAHDDGLLKLAAGEAQRAERFEIEEGAVGVQVIGDSMSPIYRDGDLLIGVVRGGAFAENLLGLDCIVELADGRRFVRPVASAGRVTLKSLDSRAEIIEDAILAWVATIVWVRRGGRS
jgi:hypothetical protein